MKVYKEIFNGMVFVILTIMGIWYSNIILTVMGVFGLAAMLYCSWPPTKNG